MKFGCSHLLIVFVSLSLSLGENQNKQYEPYWLSLKRNSGFLETRIFRKKFKPSEFIAEIKGTSFSLPKSKLENVSKKFLNNIADIGFTDELKGKSSKEVVEYIKKELANRKKLFMTVVNEETFEPSWEGDKDIEPTIRQIFYFIKSHGVAGIEKKRFKRMLDELTSGILTEAEEIAVNAYSHSSGVNAFLIDLTLNDGRKFAGHPKQTSIFKAHARLLQSAINKLSRRDSPRLVRIDTIWDGKRTDPFAGQSEVVFDKLTSTMDVSEISPNAVNDEINRVAGGKQPPRILINFINTSSGVEIAPWVKTSYLFQREVIFPVGSFFTIRRLAKPSSSQYLFEYEARDPYSEL